MGAYEVCSDWVEWRPSSGFYGRRSVVDGVGVFRSRVLPYGFGLVARASDIIGVSVDRLRSSLYGLARRLYLGLRSRPGSSGFDPGVGVSGDGSLGGRG